MFALKRRDPSGRRQGRCETRRTWSGRRSRSPTCSRRGGGSALTCAPTPLYPYAGLDELLGAEVWVKHENHQPVGAFKVRGGVNLVSQLGEDERRRGLIAASTGNHGQSVAYAARLFGVTARDLRAGGRQPGQARRDAGARRGADRARRGLRRRRASTAQRSPREHGYRYVHSGNEPLLIAGVGTETLEILEDRPDVEVIVVPIGGGSGAAGRLRRREGDPARDRGDRRAVGGGARPPSAPGRRARCVEDETATFAEGLATRVPFELPQQILWEHLDDFVLVERGRDPAGEPADDRAHAQSRRAGRRGAAGAALKLADRSADERIALIASGGNISPAQLAALYG